MAKKDSTIARALRFFFMITKPPRIYSLRIWYSEKGSSNKNTRLRGSRAARLVGYRRYRNSGVETPKP